MKCNRCKEHKSISANSESRWGENICDDCYTDTENRINAEFVQVIKFMRASHSRELGELRRDMLSAVDEVVERFRERYD